MAELAALIFDVDGTLAETEEIHRLSFNRAFAEAGLPYAWDEAIYRDLLTTTGGKRRIARFLGTQPEFDDADIERFSAALHLAKNRFYAEAIASGDTRLRPGVAALLAEAAANGVRLAIATTTSRGNLMGLLEAVSPSLPVTGFEVIVCGEDVAALKPHPEAYTRALAQLGLPAESCLAFEDSENGVMAARAAGLRTIVTPGLYTSGGDFSGAEMIVADLAAFELRRFLTK